MIIKSLCSLVVFLILQNTHGQIATIRFTNKSETVRENESIVIKRTVIEKKTGSLPNNKAILLLQENKIIIPSQLDDSNLDGNWDELAFQVTIPSKATLAITLKIVSKDSMPNFEKKTQAYMGVSRNKDGDFKYVKNEIRPKDHIAQSRPMLYQFEGVGWENDKVGFRSYFDSRNGKDIFGKTTSQLVLDSVGRPGKDYHELSDWGMDILKVGNSLGAGALAIAKDTVLYRLGGTKTATYTQISSGPVRSIIQLNYTGWQIENALYNVTEIITIWAGNYYYKSSVVITGEKLVGNITSGLVTLKNIENNKITFSPTKNTECIYSFTKQSEHHDLLGMGILYTKKNRISILDIPKKENPKVIGSTYGVVFKTKLDTPLEFYFFGGWEKSSSLFGNEKGFKSYIELEAEKIFKPMKILVN